MPAWADLLLSIDGRKSAGSRTDFEVMESLPLGFDSSLRMEIVAARPDLIERNSRQQGRWTLGLLGLAVLVSGGALVMMHHAIRRERMLSEMKSQFVASVSHELRAPVASIRLMADALEAEKVDVKTAEEFHRLIAMEGARLSTLVGNVLDHARIEQGRRVWKMEACDLAALASDTLRVMEPLAKEKNITLDSDLSPVEASVDAGAIQQALVNLLDNAIKFSPAGSSVKTSLSQDGHHCTLAVRDEGPGIPKEEQSRIFERFYRLGDELRRETQGTGIGLSLVKAIADAHGGSVRLQSEAGKGSRFILSIPIST
jgi:two-component system phosphate regulon sensor histidine kinase PhoR